MAENKFDGHKFFSFFVLFWIGLAFLGIILAMAGIFYVQIIGAYISLGIAVLFYFIYKNYSHWRLSREIALVVILSLVAIILFSYFTAPTIFSGRDQGSFSEAAIRLAQNHQLQFSFRAEKEFFNIYGPGTALNFPGFNYTPTGELITQFPLGYIAWLAIFYALFGLNGFIAANGISFFIFLMSFYLLARQYLSFSSALVSFFFILTSFVFSWFFKFTLSENMALAFLWFGIYAFIIFIREQTKASAAEKKNSRFYLLASFLSLGLLAFARVEAIAFLAVIVLILIFRYKNWKNLLFAIIGKKILLALAVIAALYLLNIFINNQAYITIAKGLLHPIASQQNGGGLLLSAYYLLRVFMAYGLFVFIFLGIFGFLYFCRREKFVFSLPFLIILPNFLYLISPNISADHPWMLRRFVFGIIPVCIFYTAIFLDRFFAKRIYFYAASGLIALASLAVFIPYLAVSPNKNLLPQINDISQNFDDSDLILVDREATGDGWAMMSGPLNFLYGKQAVYFFNPKDLAKLDLSKFSNIYFIIPYRSLALWEKYVTPCQLSQVKDYKVENETLSLVAGDKQEILRSPVELPEAGSATVSGTIYLYKK